MKNITTIPDIIPINITVLEIVEEYDISLRSYILLNVKSAVLYILLLIGIGVHYKESKCYSRVICLYLFYIMLVTSIVIFEHTYTYNVIPLLFYARMLAMIGNLWSFNLIMKPIFPFVKNLVAFKAGIKLTLLPFGFIFIWAASS